jgi:hypothetical protein
MLTPIARRELRDMVGPPRTLALWHPVGWQDPQVSLPDLRRVIDGLRNLDDAEYCARRTNDLPASGGAGWLRTQEGKMT